MPEHREDPPEQVAAWLDTPDGERWTRCQIRSSLVYHDDDSGVFADVIPEYSASIRAARWPVPYPFWDLDVTGWR